MGFLTLTQITCTTFFAYNPTQYINFDISCLLTAMELMKTRKPCKQKRKNGFAQSHKYTLSRIPRASVIPSPSNISTPSP